MRREEDDLPLTSSRNPNPDAGPCSAAATAAIPNPNDRHFSASAALYVPGGGEDAALLSAKFLSREEVLRRRRRAVRQLERVYRGLYWALMEDLRTKHSEYFSSFGLSPLELDSGVGIEGGSPKATAFALGEEGSGDNGAAMKAFGDQCGFAGCSSRAMPLTRYCHLHVLSDARQTLYKACTFAVKSGQSESIMCGKPILRAAVPSFCSIHFQRAQKHVLQALGKAGISIISSARPTQKFHVVIAEYVHQIQAKRREAVNVFVKNIAAKDEYIS